MKTTVIYTNMIDMTKKLIELKALGVDYEMEIVKGIDKEYVVKVTWVYVEEED